MLRVMTIVGTRPEIIRLSRTIKLLDENCEHVLVHTGQNYDYELNGIFFDELGIRSPDVFLEAAGETGAETIGKIVIAADHVLRKYEPEAVLILGDTNSSVSAIAAKRLKIPIFHMEAGNRCFDFNVPEEINRRIVDHISDMNLTYSEIARQYLLREGLPPEQVIVTGSPMKEVLDFYEDRISSSDVLERMSLRSGEYFVVSAHREENVDKPERLRALFDILSTVSDRYKLPIVLSVHPRTRKRIEALGIEAPSNVLFCKPFGFIDYIKLQTQAKVVLSDSGTITEESSILNFPALNLRDTHERPEGFEEAAVMFVGLSPRRVIEGVEILSSQKRGCDRELYIVKDYSPDNVSKKVLRIIFSYTDYIKRNTWKKML